MAEENRDAKNLNQNTDEIDTNSLTINIEENISVDSAPNDYEEMIGMKEEFITSKKKSPLSKILIGLISFLILVLTIGAILYFLGFFESKEEIINTKIDKIVSPVEIKEETYKFDIKDIN
jgi:hypothetical protein